MSTVLSIEDVKTNKYGVFIKENVSASESGVTEQKRDLTYFCANGLAVVVSAREDGKAGCTVTWSYEGEEYSIDLGDNTAICGGAWEGDNVASTSVTVNGGSFDSVIGGGIKSGVGTDEDNKGSILVTVNGGYLSEGVIGGSVQSDVFADVTINVGHAEGSTPAIGENIIGGNWSGTLTGDIKIDIASADLRTKVTGAFICGGSVEGDVVGNITVDYNNANGGGGSVLAGGNAHFETPAEAVSTIDGTITVNVSGGTVYSDVSGGSWNEGTEVSSSTTAEVNLTGGTVEGNVYGGHHPGAANYGYEFEGTTSVAIDTENCDLQGAVDAGLNDGVKTTGTVVENGVVVKSAQVLVNQEWAAVDKDGNLVYKDGDTVTVDGLTYTIGVTAFRTVNDAIKAVADGGTIKMLAGEYKDAITYTGEMAKKFTIIGETDAYGNNLVKQTGTVQIGASAADGGARITEPLSFENISFYLESGDKLVSVYSIFGLNFKHCSFESADSGKDLVTFETHSSGRTGLVFDDCDFANGRFQPKTIELYSYSGYDFGMKITNSTFTNVKFNVKSSHNILIEGNEFTSALGTDINYILRFGENNSSECSDVTIRKNIFSVSGMSAKNEEAGVIWVRGMKDAIVIEDNDFSGCLGLISEDNTDPIHLFYDTGSAYVPVIVTMTGNNFGTTDAAKLLALLESTGNINMIGAEENGTVPCYYYIPADETAGTVEQLIAYDGGNLLVDASWTGEAYSFAQQIEGKEGYYYGLNAFTTLNDAVAAALDGAKISANGVNSVSTTQVDVNKDINLGSGKYQFSGEDWFFIGYEKGNGSVTINGGAEVSVTGGAGFNISAYRASDRNEGKLTVDNATLNTNYILNRNILDIKNGAIVNTDVLLVYSRSLDGGKDIDAVVTVNGATLNVDGSVSYTEIGQEPDKKEGSGKMVLSNGAVWNDNSPSVTIATGSALEVDSSTVNLSYGLQLNGTATFSGNSTITAGTITGGGSIFVGGKDHKTALGDNKSSVLVLNATSVAGNIYVGNDMLETSSVTDEEGNVIPVTHTLKLSGKDTEDGKSQTMSIGGNTYVRHSGVLDIDNIDVTTEDSVTNYGKITVNGAVFTVGISGLAIVGRGEKYATGKAVVELNNKSTLSAVSGVHLGEWGGDYGTASLILNNSNIDTAFINLVKGGTVTELEGGTVGIVMNGISTIKAGYINFDGGELTINAENFNSTHKFINLDGTKNGSLEGKITINKSDDIAVIYGSDGDVMLTSQKQDVLYVDSTFKDEDGDGIVDGGTAVLGYNAFTSFSDAFNVVDPSTDTVITLSSDCTATANSIGSNYRDFDYTFNKNTVTINSDGEERTVVFGEDGFTDICVDNMTLNIGKGVTFVSTETGKQRVFYVGYAQANTATLNLDGALKLGSYDEVAVGTLYINYTAEANVSETGTVDASYAIRVRGKLNVDGGENYTAENPQLRSERLEACMDDGASITVKNSYAVITNYVSDSMDKKDDRTAKNGLISFNNSTLDAKQINMYGKSNKFSAENNSVINVSANVYNNAEMKIDNSTLESKAGIVVGAGGTISVKDSKLIAAGELNNAGTVTLSANSTLKAGTYSYATGSKITLDASNFTTGYKKVVDLSGTASLEDVIEITNKAEGVKVIYGSDGDVALTDQKQNVLYVDSTFKDEDGDGIVDGGTAVLGYNAFTSFGEAFTVAGSLGGATISLDEDEKHESAALGNDILLNKAGVYTVTGGNGVYLSNPLDFNESKDTENIWTFNVTNAFFTASKISLRMNTVMTVSDNSRIDFNGGPGGDAGYLSVDGNSRLYVKNSTIGYNPRMNAANNNYFGPTLRVYGYAEIEKSTLYLAVSTDNPPERRGFDVVGNGTAYVGKESTLYLALMNVGYNCADKRLAPNDSTDSLVATLTIDNSKVYNTQSANGVGGSQYYAVNVGGVNDRADAGKLIIQNGSFVDFVSVATNYKGLSVNNDNSRVEISGSTLMVKSIQNKGTITVSGTSTLVVSESVSGKAIELLDGATLKDSTIGFEKFDSSNGNMLIDGAVTFSGSNIIRDAEIMVGKGDSLVINGSLEAGGTLVQIKAEDGGVITLNGAFTNGAASLEMHGENSIINITQDAVYRVTSDTGVYFTAGTINVTGKIAKDAELADLTDEDLQLNAKPASATWGRYEGGALTANLTDTYFNAAWFSAGVEGGTADISLENSRMDVTMTLALGKGSLTATDSLIQYIGNGEGLGVSVGEDFTLTLVNSKFALSEGMNVLPNDGTISLTSSVISAATITNNGKIIMNGKSGLDAQSLVITVNGSIEMDWTSTLSFKSISAAAGSVTVSLAGYDKSNKMLIDYTGDETGAPTEEDYKALLGDSWNKNCFSVKDGDLILSTEGEGKITTVYVNSTYTEDNCDGHTFGTNAFASYEDAKAADPLEIITTGGEISGNQGFDGIAGKIQAGNHTAYVYGGNAGSNSSVANDSILTIDGGSFIRVAGGNRVTANKQYVDVTGASTLNINGGTFASVVCAGDHVTNGTVERNNSVALNITGGTFKNDVAGGSVLDLSKSFNGFAGVSTGDITVNISGGTFEKRIYGGNVSVYVAHSGMTKVNGDINITIDATENAVTFKDHIIAGSSGYSMVNGDVSVTLKSSQGNFKFSGILSGGGEGAAYVTSNGVRTEDSYVSGTRSLTFDGFNDSFGGTVFMFNNLSFVGGSQVEFTNSSLKLNDVASWNFGAGSSISGVSLNNFSGDELNIDLKGWDEEEWTVMSGSSAAFTGFSSADVTIDGQDTKWDSDLSAWCTMDEMYKLTLCGDGEDRKLVLTTMIA